MHEQGFDNGAAHRARRLLLCERGDARRGEMERFVQDAFAAKHGAHVHSFMPTLLALRSANDQLCSVAGFRGAGDEPLFLERYLSTPIEHALSMATGNSIARDQIVEVGNLASISCRAAMSLMLELPRFLLERGQRWMVFTATDTVRAVLDAYRAPLIHLATSQADRVAGLGDDWGHYYEIDPRVMAGFLPDGEKLRRPERRRD